MQLVLLRRICVRKYFARVLNQNPACQKKRNCLHPEEVQPGDVTAGVKRVWNAITADKCTCICRS